ncbi:MAG: hypothetical protein ACYT04_53260 [Nostoc sp.]
MNFKQFGVLLSISTVLGMNVIATKALAQDLPSIQFGQAIASSNPLFQIQDSSTVASASCGGQRQLGINIIAQSFKGSFIIIGEEGDLTDSGVKIHVNIAPC